MYKYNRDVKTGKLSDVKTIFMDSFIDNLDIDETTGDIYIGTHPKIFDFLIHAGDDNKPAPSQVRKLNK